jgi:hypothetical protein
MDKFGILVLLRAAIDADRAWQAALDAAGVYRYSAESSLGDFAQMFAAKVSTFEAYSRAYRAAA